MGSPKQEQWVRTHLDSLPAIRICQCVGGSFDVVAGAVRRAPRAFRQLHLEWFYRLACQPTRWRRQLNLLRFAREVLALKWFRHSSARLKGTGGGAGWNP